MTQHIESIVRAVGGIAEPTDFSQLVVTRFQNFAKKLYVRNRKTTRENTSGSRIAAARTRSTSRRSREAGVTMCAESPAVARWTLRRR